MCSSGNVPAVLNEDGLMVYIVRYGDIQAEPTTGYVACRFEYDAYGNDVYPWDDWNKYLAMQKAWVIFPHHISTKEWDTDANLYYFGYRWYEPRQGAFVSRTPLSILNEETYGYCGNDPVNYYDLNGLWSVSLNITAGLFVHKTDIFGRGAFFFGQNEDGSWDCGVSAASNLGSKFFNENIGYGLIPIAAGASFSTANPSGVGGESGYLLIAKAPLFIFISVDKNFNHTVTLGLTPGTCGAIGFMNSHKFLYSELKSLFKPGAPFIGPYFFDDRPGLPKPLPLPTPPDPIVPVLNPIPIPTPHPTANPIPVPVPSPG